MRLFWLGLLWLAGIAAGRATPLLTWQWLILAAISFAALLIFHRQHPYRWLFAGILLLTLGAVRLTSSKPEFGPDHVASHNDTGRNVTITGVVVDAPDIRDTYTGLRISAERIRYHDSWSTGEVHGLVLLRAPRYGDWVYGDRLRAYGTLETPPVFETFSYRDYLARQGIHSLMPYPSVTRIAARQANPLLQLIYDFRAHALETVNALFPDPEASLLAGILLGAESGISTEVRDAFNQTGTTHIIAISGFNITIIAAIFTSLFGRWLGARRGAMAAGITIALYTIFVGADAAVVRAAIMGGLSLLSLRLGRQTDSMASLSAAAAVMTLLNPLVLWDVGFQLSFTATLGLVLYAEPLHNWFLDVAKRHLPEILAKRLARPVSEFVLFTFAAQVTTLPLTAYYFKRISLSALLANPVILPAQPPVMILGGLATLAGSIYLPLGRPLAWIAWPFTAFTIRAVEFFATWPMAVIPLAQASTLSVVVFYLFLAGLTVLIKLPPERRPKIISAFSERVNIPVGFTLTALAISISLMWQMIVHRPDGRLHVTILDVGRGESVLIQSPTGRYALINGGPSPIALSEGLGRRLPILHRQLDWLVISGTGNDQVAGLAGVTERFSIGNVLLAGPPGRSAYRYLIDELMEINCLIVPAVEGHILDLGDGARLEVVTIGEHGAVLKITYHRARILLAPGADPALVNELEKKRPIGPVSVVLLPDGGNEAVNPYGWLKQLQPLVTLISVEAGNSRGLPSFEVIDTLRGRNILRTDFNGWIELTTDGEYLWAEVERDHKGMSPDPDRANDY